MVTDTYIIRTPQNKGEWEEVKKLLLDYKHEFRDDTCFTSFEEEIADIEHYYAQDDRWKLIAVSEADGSIMGCVALRKFSPGVTEMKRLYVVPAHRGHQLGRKLAETIIEKAIHEGYEKMILDTMNEMKTAQQLYDQLGFFVTGPYNDQDVSKVICFEKNLLTI